MRSDSTDNSSFDPTWDEIYNGGRMLNRYPYDAVVAFVYRHAPRDKPRGETSIVEVGCGAANNLWFAAREGFRVAGIDGAPAAIEAAIQRFRAEGLSGDLRVSDMVALPFESASFDLAIDRGGITCLPISAAQQAIAEIQRTLKPGGKLFFNPASRESTSFLEASESVNGTCLNIRSGTFQGVGHITFYDLASIHSLFDSARWRILSSEHAIFRDEAAGGTTHAEWRCVISRV